MNINFNGTPVGNPNSYEIFTDFIFDTTRQSSTGYIATGIAQAQNGSIDIFDINIDGIIDSFTETWTDSAGVPWVTSGTLTWDTNGLVLAHKTAETFGKNDTDHYGRLAYNAQGQVVGMNWLNISPIFTLTPDTVAGDAAVARFQIVAPSGTPGNWTLLDNNLDGTIDHATEVQTWIDENNVTQSETGNCSITWSDATHFTAHDLIKIKCLTFDSQGRPTSFIDVTHTDGGETPFSILWLNTKAADNAVATSPDSSSRLYDTNGDNFPDQMPYTTTHPDRSGIVRTGSGVMNIIGWTSLSPTNPFLVLENQSDSFPGGAWTGTITGTSSNPTTITMPSYLMGSPGNTIITPTTTTNPGGLTTIRTSTMYSARASSDSMPLITDPALTNPTILNVIRPAGLTFIAKSISGTAITDLKSHLLASVGTTLAADTAIQSGIDTYLATIPTADQANVTVRTLTFSAPSSVSAGSLIVDGNTAHQEALVIDTTNLPAGSQIDLNNVDFAVIIGDNVTIRGGAGANLVYAGSGAQDIKLGVDDDTIHGGDGNDNIASTTGNDWLYGDAGNDTLTGGADNDHLDGGAGDDTAVFTGKFADYAISYDAVAQNYTVTDSVVGRDGTDVVSNVEHFQFLDGTKEYIIAPVVVSISPINHATRVGVSDNVVLTFSEAIHAGTGTIAIHSSSATGMMLESYDVATSANLTISGNTLTINPTADFANGMHYFVTFENGNITDLEGNISAGTNTYDFTTEALPPVLHDLTGNFTFWNTGTAISGVSSTLTSVPASTGTHLVEFRNIQTAADGSRTIEIWETSAKTDLNSLQLELALPTGSTASWQDAANLPAGWSAVANTGLADRFILGGMGTTALYAGPVKLGTLTLAAPANPQHFELSLRTGWLGNDTIHPFGIASDSMTTGADGLYQHFDMPDGTYALTSAKVSGTAESNAIRANDALAALKIAVGINPNADNSAVSSYQYLAADVNKDGQVKAADALNILKMAVKLTTAPENEWLFVPDTVVNEAMSRTHVVWPDNPITVTLDVDQDVHLIGIVKGDINGSWAA